MSSITTIIMAVWINVETNLRLLDIPFYRVEQDEVP